RRIRGWRLPLLRRCPVCRFRRAHRPSRLQLGHAARVYQIAGRSLSARDDRLPRPRAGDDARRGAGAKPVPERAARGAPAVSGRFEAPRGTYDVLPADQPLRQRAIDEFERLCALYGYRRIQTPVFEDTELFARTAGESSDVVRKEMYTFTDRGDRSLTLRAEATAPIVRAYLQHGLHRQPQPAKLYAVETIYRYGRPGKGRFREHWQLDLEAIGSDDPAVDAEVI